MSAKVVTIGLREIGDERAVPARMIIKAARKAGLVEAAIIGYDENGELWVASSLNAGQSLYLIEKLKIKILENGPGRLVSA